MSLIRANHKHQNRITRKDKIVKTHKQLSQQGLLHASVIWNIKKFSM